MLKMAWFGGNRRRCFGCGLVGSLDNHDVMLNGRCGTSGLDVLITSLDIGRLVIRSRCNAWIKGPLVFFPIWIFGPEPQISISWPLEYIGRHVSLHARIVPGRTRDNIY